MNMYVDVVYNNSITLKDGDTVVDTHHFTGNEVEQSMQCYLQWRHMYQRPIGILVEIGYVNGQVTSQHGYNLYQRLHNRFPL